jgi:hypothetical protein
MYLKVCIMYHVSCVYRIHIIIGDDNRGGSILKKYAQWKCKRIKCKEMMMTVWAQAPDAGAVEILVALCTSEYKGKAVMMLRACER